MRIEADNVSVAFGARPILREVGLAVTTGEMLGLIGPNGAGKTTLLRVLAGLLRPDSGTVLHDGVQLDLRTQSRRLAYLAQGGPVQWQLRAEALVALGRLPHRRPLRPSSASDQEAIERAMQATDVLAVRNRTIGTLSGGERMRVLLARALAVEAPFLLADEPLAGLDPRHQLETIGLLRRAAVGGAGVVLVLHDLSLASRFCNRLILLDGGSVIADGTPRQVLTDEALARAFGIEVARATHNGEGFILPWRPRSEHPTT